MRKWKHQAEDDLSLNPYTSDCYTACYGYENVKFPENMQQRQRNFGLLLLFAYEA